MVLLGRGEVWGGERERCSWTRFVLGGFGRRQTAPAEQFSVSAHTLAVGLGLEGLGYANHGLGGRWLSERIASKSTLFCP
jgi:hypothetical protein